MGRDIYIYIYKLMQILIPPSKYQFAKQYSHIGPFIHETTNLHGFAITITEQQHRFLKHRSTCIITHTSSIAIEIIPTAIPFRIAK